MYKNSQDDKRKRSRITKKGEEKNKKIRMYQNWILQRKKKK